MSIADLLQELQNQKDNLADNLQEKGVLADKTEGFTTLVPKVLDVQGVGESIEIQNTDTMLINALISHLLTGNYETGTFNVEGIGTAPTVIFDTNLDSIHGIVYFDTDISEFTQENETSSGAQRSWGIGIFDPDSGTTSVVDAVSRTYAKKDATSANIVSKNFLVYASYDISGGSLTVTGQYNFNANYTPFKQNHTYRWIAW